MAEVSRSSFIPKQVPGSIPGRVHKRKRFYIFGFLSTLIFVASLMLAGGTFFYKDYTKKQLVEQQQKLEEERGIFNEGDILRLKEFDRRIAAARYLLNKHLSPTKVFEALELSTKKKVQFTDFKYEYGDTGFVNVSISGATKEFKTVALQSLQFGGDTVFKNSAVTSLTAADSGEQTGNDQVLVQQGETVGFGITAFIPQSTVAYEGTAVPPQPDVVDVVETPVEPVGDATTTTTTNTGIENVDTNVSESVANIESNVSDSESQ